MPVDPAPSADWLGRSDVALLRTIATAVVKLADVTGLHSFALPYPAEAQRALDRTVYTCLLQDAQPPTSLLDLLHWCRERPLADWPLDLPAEAFGPDDYLINADSGMPTQLCHEWWLQGKDNAAAQYDRRVVRWAMQLCREAASPESYTEFRRVLVDKPVLTSVEEVELATNLFLEPVRSLLADIYEPAPASCRQGGVYVTCHRCLTLLTPLTDGSWWCERDHCRSLGPAPRGRVLSAAAVGEVNQLVRPLRQFVTGPGRAEVEVERRLRNLGLAVEMWPGFDAYDLRVTFPDDHVWAIDVKDWAHPGLLGRSARLVSPEPPFDEACWVVPQYRVHARRDYLGVYARNRPASAGGLRLLTDSQLVTAAKARLKGQRGAAACISSSDNRGRGGSDA